MHSRLRGTNCVSQFHRIYLNLNVTNHRQTFDLSLFKEATALVQLLSSRAAICVSVGAREELVAQYSLVGQMVLNLTPHSSTTFRSLILAFPTFYCFEPCSSQWVASISDLRRTNRNLLLKS